MPPPPCAWQPTQLNQRKAACPRESRTGVLLVGAAPAAAELRAAGLRPTSGARRRPAARSPTPRRRCRTGAPRARSRRAQPCSMTSRQQRTRSCRAPRRSHGRGTPYSSRMASISRAPALEDGSSSPRNGRVAAADAHGDGERRTAARPVDRAATPATTSSGTCCAPRSSRPAAPRRRRRRRRRAPPRRRCAPADCRRDSRRTR